MNLRVEHMGRRIYLLEDDNTLVAEMTSDRDYECRLSQAVHIMEAVNHVLAAEADILREFVADVEAVHDWAREEWPDLMVTYRKAKGLLDNKKDGK